MLIFTLFTDDDMSEISLALLMLFPPRIIFTVPPVIFRTISPSFASELSPTLRYVPKTRPSFGVSVPPEKLTVMFVPSGTTGRDTPEVVSHQWEPPAILWFMAAPSFIFRIIFPPL